MFKVIQRFCFENLLLMFLRYHANFNVEFYYWFIGKRTKILTENILFESNIKMDVLMINKFRTSYKILGIDGRFRFVLK